MNNLLFLPVDIDVPKLDFPELVDIQSDIIGSSFWDYEQLLDTSINDNFPWKKNLNQTRQHYRNLIEQLPFESLDNVRVSIQTKTVKPHVDISEETKKRLGSNYNHYIANEPCGYRILISGNQSSLKLIVSGKIVSTYLPSVPGLYLINSTTCRHFVDKDIGRKTIYIRGLVKQDEHQDLIERSLQKFKEYAIYC